MKDEELNVRRRSSGSTSADGGGPTGGFMSATGETAPTIVSEALHSPGEPLDATSRRFMEQRLGHDFSRVRVHTDTRAAASAIAIDASAYTLGNDIVFAAGGYRPQTASGLTLLAHELTHVMQQDGLSTQMQLAPRLGDRSDGYEREADQIATSLAMDGPSTQIAGRPSIQRTKGVYIGAGLGGAAIGALIGGYAGGGLGALVGGAIGGLVGLGLAALGRWLFGGSKVEVDSSCDKFCPAIDVGDEGKKADAKTGDGCREVRFNYRETGSGVNKTFDQKIDFNKVTLKCSAAEPACGGFTTRGLITIGKGACNSATCGKLSSSILHEMVHDWAGWGPPYDKQNIVVPGAGHTQADYLDEWAARYVEKSCFGENPWGVP
jgi:hypothetical protein